MLVEDIRNIYRLYGNPLVVKTPWFLVSIFPWKPIHWGFEVSVSSWRGCVKFSSISDGRIFHSIPSRQLHDLQGLMEQRVSPRKFLDVPLWWKTTQQKKGISIQIFGWVMSKTPKNKRHLPTSVICAMVKLHGLVSRGGWSSNHWHGFRCPFFQDSPVVGWMTTNHIPCFDRGTYGGFHSHGGTPRMHGL